MKVLFVNVIDMDVNVLQMIIKFVEDHNVGLVNVMAPVNASQVILEIAVIVWKARNNVLIQTIHQYVINLLSLLKKNTCRYYELLE